MLGTTNITKFSSAAVIYIPSSGDQIRSIPITAKALVAAAKKAIVYKHANAVPNIK